jgi:aspartokinase-like uncharacterized kinase
VAVDLRLRPHGHTTTTTTTTTTNNNNNNAYATYFQVEPYGILRLQDDVSHSFQVANNSMISVISSL